jgi:putative transposase
MKRDTKKYAHGIKRIWVHMSFKVKYCHEIFNHKEIREECEKLMKEVADKHDIEIKSIGFDANHFHFIPDLGHYSEPHIKKLFKGTNGRKILKKFPWLKRRYFLGSGLWGRQYYCYSIGSDMNALQNYMKKQKYFTVMQDKVQTKLSAF